MRLPLSARTSEACPSTSPPVQVRVDPGAPLSTCPLVQKDSLRWVGAFNMPGSGTDYNGPRAAYGSGALTYNPARNSLFLSGYSDRKVESQRAAELEIPEVTADSRAVGRYLQAFADPTDGKRSGDLIGGFLVFRGRLITSSYEYYDARKGQTASHFASGIDLSIPKDAVGPFTVGPLNPGFVSGYMLHIPRAWQEALGGPAFTGNCCLSIISRTSLGPSVSVFDPSDVGAKNPVPATMLLGDPIDHPTLGLWNSAPSGVPGVYGPANDVYNGTVEVHGAVFPEGTRSILFFGRIGTGPFCYSVACFPDASQSMHAAPYRYQVWAYDALDLVKVKEGTRQPWDVEPYATWELKLPVGPVAAESYGLAGVAYDPGTGRIFVMHRNKESPLIQVFTVQK